MTRTFYDVYLELFSAVPFCINKIDRKIDVQEYFIAFLMYWQTAGIKVIMFIFIKNANVSDKNVKWGTLHLKSRQRRREIYFPKYIYIFVLSIEKRLGVNCPNLGKIIERRWSDNFTRLSEVLHEVVQMWEHTFF